MGHLLVHHLEGHWDKYDRCASQDSNNFVLGLAETADEKENAENVVDHSQVVHQRLSRLLMEGAAADSPGRPYQQQPIRPRKAPGRTLSSEQHAHRSDKDKDADDSEAEGTKVHGLAIGHVAPSHKQRKGRPPPRKREQSPRRRQNKN